MNWTFTVTYPEKIDGFDSIVYEIVNDSIFDF